MNTSTNSNFKKLSLMVWLLASVFYAYQYILRVMPSVMVDDIMQQFHINAAAYGQFSGIYYIGYSLMHLPIGIFLDRFGPRKIMTGCILITVLGLLPIIFSDNWIYPVAGRALIGIGSSAAILGLFKIVRMSFSEAKFTRMLSISVMIGLLGAIYGGGPLSIMCENIGYQAVIKILAFMGIGLALITYCVVPEVECTRDTAVQSDLKTVFGNKKVVWTCVLAGLMVGPLEGFADVWSAAFLKQAYGFDSTVASSLPSILFLGMCFGGPVLSIFAEKTGNYIATIIGAGIIMAGLFTYLLLNQHSPFMVSISFAIIGLCCSYQILAIYKASTYVPEHVAGLTTAAANMIIMIFGYAFHSIIGYTINAMGGPNVTSALIYGIGVIPIALCLSIAGYTLLLFSDKEQKLPEQKLA